MATKTTIEVPVEEQTTQQEIVPQVSEEQSVTATEEPTAEVADEVNDIAQLNKDEVLARLAE